MYCSNCGNLLPDGANFCNKCGHKVGAPVPNVTQNTTSIQDTKASENTASESRSDLEELLNKASQAREDQKPRKKKRKFKYKFLLFSIVVFVIGFIITVSADGIVGNILLLLSGGFDLIAAIVLFAIYSVKSKLTCPECGTRRVHKRVWLNTTEQMTRSTVTERISYTHRYEDYYICPECGETLKKIITKSGGSIVHYFSNGNIVDKTISYDKFLGGGIG